MQRAMNHHQPMNPPLAAPARRRMTRAARVAQRRAILAPVRAWNRAARRRDGAHCEGEWVCLWWLAWRDAGGDDALGRAVMRRYRSGRRESGRHPAPIAGALT